MSHKAKCSTHWAVFLEILTIDFQEWIAFRAKMQKKKSGRQILNYFWIQIFLVYQKFLSKFCILLCMNGNQSKYLTPEIWSEVIVVDFEKNII